MAIGLISDTLMHTPYSTNSVSLYLYVVKLAKKFNPKNELKNLKIDRKIIAQTAFYRIFFGEIYCILSKKINHIFHILIFII